MNEKDLADRITAFSKEMELLFPDVCIQIMAFDDASNNSYYTGGNRLTFRNGLRALSYLSRTLDEAFQRKG